MAAQQTDSNVNDQIEGRKALKRRGILAAAGAVVAGIMAKQMAEPVAAAEVFNIPGDYTASAIGTVWKITNTGSGNGIQALGGALGVGAGANNAGGTGVFGGCDATGGMGVYGRAAVATGVYGQSSGDTNSMGVHGKHMSNGYGVYGESAAGGYGVTGVTSGDSDVSRGVFGSVPNYGYGVYGHAGIGSGVYGTAAGGVGVYGTATSGTGVYGSTSGAGNVAGLYGTSSTTYGIIGNTTAAGYSGLTGVTSTPGVAALAAASTTTAAYAAYFTGTTVVQGDFYVVKNPDGTGGGKFAAVAHADGSYRGVYCTESPEPWFEDFGEGKVVNGRVDVPLDPEFAALIHTDTYHVFLTAHSDQHLHVPQRTPTGFSVAMTKVGAGQGTAAGEQTFSWRVVGKRKDIAGTRLPKVDLPKIKTPDPNNLPRFEPPKNKP